MNSLFKESIILTRRYTRFGGDSESTLALVVDERNVAYIYSNSENDVLGCSRMFSITSCPKYVEWLLFNAMDLLEMVEGYPVFEFYNDRNVVDGRRKEFKYLLDKL